MASGASYGVTTTGVDVPHRVDRLIVHQMDVTRPVPGGIDGAIRGLLRFAPESDVVAVVGVIADLGDTDRRAGRWERYEIDGRTVYFLPVARLDASDQSRKVPHSIRLIAGLVRYRRRLPQAETLHAHRADTAWSSSRVIRKPPLAYFVHTQAHGLSSGDTDSFWRRAPKVHEAMERSVVKRARAVVVFNPDYAQELARLNPSTMFSPSWFEPDLIPFTTEPSHPHRIVWLGRLEGPKDPALAIDVMTALVAKAPDEPWTLEVIGSGTLSADLDRIVAALPPEVASRVHLAGRLSPAEVGAVLAESGVFLMTSRPGYEGHPRVLIEALASGLPSVVTQGSDTGSLVADGVNGYVCSRDPAALAQAVRDAALLDRLDARQSVDSLSGPAVVATILSMTDGYGS